MSCNNQSTFGPTVDNDSSPSCCATTSCDSFSFQQFQQHLRNNQTAAIVGDQNSLLNSVPPPPIRMRSTVTKQTTSCLSAKEKDSTNEQNNAIESSSLMNSGSVPILQQSTQLQPNLTCDRVVVPSQVSSDYQMLSSIATTNRSRSTRPKSLFNPLLDNISSQPPFHFMLDSYASCTDLSYNSFQLESQLCPSNVRQATARYLINSGSTSGIPSTVNAGKLPGFNSVPFSTNSSIMVSTNSSDRVVKQLADLAISSPQSSSATVATLPPHPRPKLSGRSMTDAEKLYRQQPSTDQYSFDIDDDDDDDVMLDLMGSEVSTHVPHSNSTCHATSAANSEMDADEFSNKVGDIFFIFVFVLFVSKLFLDIVFYFNLIQIFKF